MILVGEKKGCRAASWWQPSSLSRSPLTHPRCALRGVGGRARARARGGSASAARSASSPDASRSKKVGSFSSPDELWTDLRPSARATSRTQHLFQQGFVASPAAPEHQRTSASSGAMQLSCCSRSSEVEKVHASQLQLQASSPHVRGKYEGNDKSCSFESWFQKLFVPVKLTSTSAEMIIIKNCLMLRHEDSSKTGVRTVRQSHIAHKSTTRRAHERVR